MGLGLGVECFWRSRCKLAVDWHVSSYFLLSFLLSDCWIQPCSAPLIQSSHRNTTIFVWVTFAVSFVAYARFVTLVIQDITNFLGIACFTVRKKDENGVWHDARPDVKKA